jgi:hypothetical protein
MSWPSTAWNRLHISPETSSEIERLYLEERLDHRTVAKQVGLKSGRVLRELHLRNIVKPRLRQKLDAAVRGLGQQNGVNLDFLRVWTAESAWVWGLWFGDGWLSPAAQFGFSGDRDVIYRVKALLETNAEPYQAIGAKKTEQGWRLVVHSRGTASIIEERFGLRAGKKSALLRLPPLPDSCERHFVRGLWDADGCWSRVRAQGRSYLQATFVSVSESLVVDLRDCLIRTCHLGAKRIEFTEGRGNKSSYWRLRYGRNDGRLLGEWLYQGTNSSNRSDRKFKRWEAILAE